MGIGNRPSGGMIDFRLDVLDERSTAVDIQRLQPVTDSQDGLAAVVGVLQEKFVGCVPLDIGSGGFGMWLGLVLPRINIGTAAGKEHGTTAFELFQYLVGGQVKFDSYRIATCQPHRFFILRERTLGIDTIA